jgi:REP element-mobilizing transposase RayT
MRPLRFVPPNSLFEISIRTVQGRLLLRPSAATNAAIIGVLGLAQSRYSMVIHHFVVMSNHIHLLLSPRDAQHLAQFMCFVNSNIAREVGRLVDWRDRFWSGRYHAILVSNEMETQVSRLRYLLAQGVKEGLVAHPFEWPGASSLRALVHGTPMTGTWLDRAALYRARQRWKAGDPPVNARPFETVYPITIEPLPGLAHLDATQRRALIQELIAEIVGSTAALRAEQSLTELGVSAVVAKHPHVKGAASRSPAPLFHALRVEVSRRLRDAYRIFVAAYRDAAALVKIGVDGAVFPDGCFPPPRPFVPYPAT